MKHRVVGRKLGRTSAHRLAMLRNLSTALFERERVVTTLGRAKELRPFAERLVTLSKRETLHARRQVLRHIRDGEVVAKLFDTISARFAQRPGGYTRILKLGPRRGDNAEMALVELVGFEPDLAKKKAGAAKGKGEAKPGKGAATDAKAAKATKDTKDTKDTSDAKAARQAAKAEKAAAKGRASGAGSKAKATAKPAKPAARKKAAAPTPKSAGGKKAPKAK
jgi:large subunit ribosomal protein L17